MKTKSLFLISLLLFQSCFSYKELESGHEGLVIGTEYKLNHVEYGKFKKGRVIAMTDSILTYEIQNGKINELPLDGIQQIKKGKFSLGKTIALPVSITGAVLGAAWLAWNNTSLDLGY